MGVLRTILHVATDGLRLVTVVAGPRTRLAAENLFLRKQLALYAERQVKPRRADDATRITLVILSRWIDWRGMLTVVQPDTLIRWHRKGFQLLWRWKSKPPGRPRLPADVRQLIGEMALANPTWGDERIVAELFVEVGHMPSGGGSGPRRISQCWTTFVAITLGRSWPVISS